MLRIASLLPSLTEIACALGCRESLVARSHECDFPKGVEELPALTAPNFEADGTSRDIDDRVRHLVRDGLSVYTVDVEKLQELAPDIILTQDQCEVCAASLSEVEAALAQWLGKKPEVLSMAPRTLDDVWRDIERIGTTVGRREAGRAFARRLAKDAATIAKRSEEIGRRPRVACIEWIDPLMAAGNWMPELVEIAGGENLFGRKGEHSENLEWNALLASQAEVVVVIPCGFSLERIGEEMHLLDKHSGWETLPAVQNGRVYVADGNQYFNRSGPRLLESIQILAEILHPEVFSFGREAAWRHWPS